MNDIILSRPPRPRPEFYPEARKLTEQEGQEWNAAGRGPTPTLRPCPSVAKVGWSLSLGNRCYSGVFKPKAVSIQRIREVYDWTLALLKLYRVSHVGIEGYSFGSLNSRAHATGEIGGVIRLALNDLSIPSVEIPPTSLKKFVSGKGNTPKASMGLALYKRYGLYLTNEDQVDSAGLSIMALAFFHRECLDLVGTQRESLSKVSRIV